MRKTKLGEIARVFNGNSINAADKDKHYRGVHGMPYIGTAEVGFDSAIDYASGVAIPASKLHSFKVAKAGTTLVCAEGGSAGRKVGFLDRDVCFGNKLFAIEPSPVWAGKFLYYFCQSDAFREQFRSLTTGLIGGVSIKKFKDIKLPRMSLQQQRRIVAALDEAFGAIATAYANAEKNLANARELFDAELRALFAAGAIGWTKSKVGDQITLQRGFDITKKDQRIGTVPVVSSSGIKSHHDSAMVRGPGVVIGRKGTLGSVFYIGEDFWPHDTTLWVKDFNGNDPKLVYYLFHVLDVKRLDTGAANPSLNRNLVHEIQIYWPSEVCDQSAVVQRLESLLSASEQLADLYNGRLANLFALKRSLLHRAFSGEPLGAQLLAA